MSYFRAMPKLLNTVNVDISAQLNFHASRNWRHIREVNLFAHIPVNSLCFIMIIIFTHIKFLHKMCENM